MTDAQNSPFEPIPQTLRYHQLDQPDNQIRLLDLTHDLVHQKISGKLRIVSLDDDPVYDAISYVWGDPKDLRRILVDGEWFNVTKSQEEVLARLHDKGFTTIWIDGVCIDQHNLSERNVQVANMKKVFQLANEVHLWIGPELDYAGWDKMFCEKIAPSLEQAWRDDFWKDILKPVAPTSKDADYEANNLRPDILQDEFLQQVHLMKSRTPLRQMPFYYIDQSSRKPLPRKLWHLANYMFYEICESTWWERVWTVQEVLFTKKETHVHLGSVSLPLTPILIACRYFLDQDYQYDDHGTFSQPQETRRLRKAIFLNVSIMKDTAHLFQATAILGLRAGLKRPNMTGLSPDVGFSLALERKVSDPRDFIYGVLGLLDDQSRSIVQPDYRDNDVGSLFRKASRYVVQTATGALNLGPSRGTVDAHLKTGDFTDINVDEPTWGLSWGTKEPGLWKPRDGGRAHGNTKHIASINDISLRHLTVSGSIIGTVTDLGLRGSDHWRSGKDGYLNPKFELDVIDNWRALAGLNDDIDRSQHPPDIEGSLEKRFWRVLTDGQPDDESEAGKYSWTSWLPRPTSRGTKSWNSRIDGPNPQFKWKLLKGHLAKDHANAARISAAKLEEYAEMSLHWHTKQKVLFRFNPVREGPFRHGGPFIGISRLSTQVDDTLAILKGCEWPVVLRPAQEANMWKWVGPAYVDELVDGQWVTPDVHWTSLTLV